MYATGRPIAPPIPSARAEVTRALEDRRPEIEEAILTRSLTVSRPTGAGSADYLTGLGAAITAALSFGLAAIELGVERAGAVPPEVLSQARRSAQHRVELAVVLRRYAAGYSAIADFLSRAATGAHLGPAEACGLHRELTAVFDRLVDAVACEYRAEAERLATSSARRSSDRVRRMLAGEFLDLASLGYRLEGIHLGIVARHPASAAPIRDCAESAGARSLVVEGEEGNVWGWLVGPEDLDPVGLGEALAARATPQMRFGIGEPGADPAGWRRTHRQARVALEVGSRGEATCVAYRDVAAMSVLARDPDLLHHLSATYLAPLEADRDGGTAMRATLRAYLACGRNVSSAAAALGLARQTVASRLLAFERKIDRPLARCGADLELILGWDQLGS